MGMWARLKKWNKEQSERYNEAQQAKAEAQQHKAEAAATERAERIAKATGPDGVIKGRQATWDGKVLHVRGGTIVLPNGRKKGNWTGVNLPVQRIASAATGVASVRVTGMDGREYRFTAPAEMAEAIEDALANQT